MRRLTLPLLFLCASLQAALPKPGNVSVALNGPVPVFRWDASEGAAIYRVAVFGNADEEGKRPLMAAVWVRGLSWPYGNGKVLPRAGKLPSTTPLPLAPGMSYKVMVSAANEDGSGKSDWSAADFQARMAPASAARAALSSTPTPPQATFTSTPTPTPALDARSSTSPAELEVDLAAEFKETPEAGELGLTKTAAPATLESARALLQAGKSDDAELAYKELLDKDASNADYWEGLGDSFDARKMKVEALEAYEKALAIDKKRERLKKWMEENVKH